MITSDEESNNRQLQEEERLALTSIFGDSAYVPDPRYPHTYILTLDIDDSFDSPTRSSQRTLHMGVHMPSTYPSREQPLYEITTVYCGTMRVTDEMLRAVDEGFRARFVLGEVVVFEWASWLREYFEKRFEEEEKEEEGQSGAGRRSAKVEMDEDATEEGEKEVSLLSEQEAEEMEGEDGGDSTAPPIAHGEPLTDRRSVFVAHAAPVSSVAEVQAVIRALYTNKRIARATHNIRAYRIVQPDGRMLQDNDDDGETAAGGRLMHLMQILDVKNVVVVVTRWYGGIQLGADRFKHINNVARQVLEENGYLPGDDAKKVSGGKKGESSKKKKGKR